MAVGKADDQSTPGEAFLRQKPLPKGKGKGRLRTVSFEAGH